MKTSTRTECVQNPRYFQDPTATKEYFSASIEQEQLPENCNIDVQNNSADEFEETAENFSDEEIAGMNEVHSFSTDDFQKLHAGTNCTITDAMLMIYTFSVEHGLTWTATEDLTRLVNRIAGKNVLSPSKYIFKKKFSKISETNPITHIICHFCDRYLGKLSCVKESNLNVCPNCKTEIQTDTKYKKNHFITIPIKLHLKNVLERNYERLNSNFNSDPSVICDVHDSLYFQQKRSESKNESFITLTINTDGAPVFASTKDNSLWPIQFLINEIDIEHRFQRENILCAAFSFGKTPSMQVFLKPLIEEINEINAAGGVTFTTKNNENRTVKISPMIITADTPAKSHILNKVNFNGYKGCPYCLHKGTPVSGQVRYCKNDEGSKRTNEMARHDMIKAELTGKRFNGYFGVSALLGLDQSFDVVWQMAIDKMHSIDIGVAKRIINIFLDNKNRGEP